MLTRLMATTAIVATMTTGAFAEAHTKSVFDSEVNILVTADEAGFYEADKSQLLASNLLGASLYTSAQEQGDRIGDINDVIMSPNGDVVAAIVGVGGFLGIGEKEVAVDFSKIQWQTGEDGVRWLTGDLSKEALEAAPEFDRTIFASSERVDTAKADGSSDMMKEDPTALAAANQERLNNNAVATPEETLDTADAGTMKPVTVAEDRAQLQAEAAPARVKVQDAGIEATELVGYSVTGANGDRVGEVGEILLNTEGKVDAVIVDVGGFLGIGEKEVAVGFDDLTLLRLETEEDWSSIEIGFTEEQLEAQPEFDDETYRTNPDSVVLRMR
jgi:sporulation protein YlmC with PRC-barrel domain